ncbi:MAG TPA: hypothetical protein DD490_26460 [Acidobacteria bacterium]|nr:hypothetical protein [Acidobacteriota bacterium]
MEIFATFGSWAAAFLAVLGRASLHGAVAIAAVWLLCRLFPRLPATVRCGLWWLACLKLLVALVWVEPVSLAWLPAPEVAAASVVSQDIKDFKDGKDPRTQGPRRAGGPW